MLDFRLTLLTACVVAFLLTAINISSLAGVLQHHHEFHHHEHTATEIRFRKNEDQKPSVLSVHTNVESGIKKDEPRATVTVAAKGTEALDGTVRTYSTDKCPEALTHTEYWGDVVKWGSNNKVDTWAECCEQCASHRANGPEELECNVWVYCADKDACGNQYQECWLKHLSHPDATRPRAQGPDVPWVSGMRLMSADQEDQVKEILTRKGKKIGGETDDDKKYHFILSAQGFVTHWQTRIHYWHYQKVKKECEANPPCHMGGFTRILHSGEPDDLMDEIPTIVVDPLPPEKNKGYVVLNRPWAFIQWLRVQNIREKNIIMVEPDHIMLRPIPNLMKNGMPAAFPFFYIEPAKRENVEITRKFVGDVSVKELEKIAPIGNSPTFIALDDFASMAQLWMDTTVKIFEYPPANKVWGWVLEMYGFTIAEYLAKIGPVSLHLNLIAQPPWDDKLGDFYMIHYTYGQDFNAQGKFTPGKVGFWHWDKRDFMSKAIPRNIPLPPAGCTNEVSIKLIEKLNEATAAIDCWDEYVSTRRVHKKNALGTCEPVPVSTSRNTMDKFPDNY